MTTKIKLGDGDNMGVSLPVIDDYSITIGTGANDFVQTAATATGTDTASVTAGGITNSTIKFGNGDQNIVQVGAYNVTATATGANNDSTAGLTIAGTTSIGGSTTTGDVISFGNGSDDSVQMAPTATVTANADTSTGAATATTTVTTGDISYDTITFRNGDGDSVQVGTTTLDLTATGGNATINATVTADGSITDDTITFGNGKADFVEVANNVEFTAVADAHLGTGPTFGNASNTVTINLGFGHISNNVITFGNGDNDYVKLAPPGADITQEGLHGPGGTGKNLLHVVTSFDGKVNDNTITFGQGNGDYVDVTGDLIHNTITFGNGNADAVSATGNFHTKNSGNNNITMGNGNNDSVALVTGLTSPGGDTIVTGTGKERYSNRWNSHQPRHFWLRNRYRWHIVHPDYRCAER
jgi:hypothetical protein